MTDVATRPEHVTVEERWTDAYARGDWPLVAELSAYLDTLDAILPPPDLMRTALWYAENGLHVFPLTPKAKVPMPGSKGCKEATTDRAQVMAWWRATPTANIGLATGHGVDVIDFDGAKGHASWGRVFDKGDAPWGEGVRVLATVSTPRPGGLHVYVPASGKGNRAAMVPGVDYRGLGGYVLAPTSSLDDRPGQHAGAYRFLRTLNPRDV